MQKRYLLAPGLTQIPPEVLLKMAEPIIRHRDIVEKYGVTGAGSAQGQNLGLATSGMPRSMMLLPL